MSELIVAFLYVVLSEIFAWIAGLLLAFYLVFYLITLLVEQLSPEELKPD